MILAPVLKFEGEQMTAEATAGLLFCTPAQLPSIVGLLSFHLGVS